MNIGILYKKEKYLSLNILNRDIIGVLKKKYDIISYCISDVTKRNQYNIENIYTKSDCVIHLSSKCIDYKRKNYKPTIFLGHAWMDHGAGINLYQKRDYILPNDIITFASHAALKKYKFIYPQGIKSFLLPYFTTVKKFSISSKKENEIRNIYNIPLNKKIIVYYGRFCSEKNIEKIIDVFNKIDRKDTCLLLIGNFSNERTYGFGNLESVGEEYKETISKLINKKGSNIILITQIKRDILFKILSFSNIYINMTKCYEEDFGISTIEAMKLGIPTICSDRGGTKDLIIHKKTGFLVKTSLGNKYNILYENDGLVDYINTILDTDKIYQKISNAAKNRAEYMYGEQCFLKNIDKILLYAKNNNNTATIQPKAWIKKVYDKALKDNKVRDIYITNPDLFNKMYRFYISKQ